MPVDEPVPPERGTLKLVAMSSPPAIECVAMSSPPEQPLAAMSSEALIIGISGADDGDESA